MNISDQVGFVRSLGSRALVSSKLRSKAEKSDADKHELHKVIESSHEILAKADTVFPLTLFPDTVSIDRTKLNIIKRNFFRLAETSTIRIEDILNVTATIGPFFGTLKIMSRVFNNEEPVEINFLWRDDAIELKHVIQGYIIAL